MYATNTSITVQYTQMKSYSGNKTMINFTKHARIRMDERDISEQAIKRALWKGTATAEPSEVTYGCYKVSHAGIVAVFAIDEQDNIIILTTYKAI